MYEEDMIEDDELHDEATAVLPIEELQEAR